MFIRSFVKIGLIVGLFTMLVACGGTGSPIYVLDQYQTQADFEALYALAESNDGYVTVNGVDLFVTRSHGDNSPKQAGHWIKIIDGETMIVFSLNCTDEIFDEDEKYIGGKYAEERGEAGFRCTKTYEGSLNKIVYSKAYFNATGVSQGTSFNWYAVVDNPRILEDYNGSYESIEANEGYSPIEGMFVVMPNDTLEDINGNASYNTTTHGTTLEGEQGTIIVLQLR